MIKLKKILSWILLIVAVIISGVSVYDMFTGEYFYDVLLLAFIMIIGCCVLSINVAKDVKISHSLYLELYENGIDNINSEKNLKVASTILSEKYNKDNLTEQQIREFYNVGKNEEVNKEQNLKKQSKSTKILVYFILFIIAIFVLIKVGGAVNKPNWGDLSEQEKQEAEWAYEMKEFIDDYKENNN